MTKAFDEISAGLADAIAHAQGGAETMTILSHAQHGDFKFRDEAMVFHDQYHIVPFVFLVLCGTTSNWDVAQWIERNRSLSLCGTG